MRGSSQQSDGIRTAPCAPHTTTRQLKKNAALNSHSNNHFFKDKDVAQLVPNNCGVGPAGEPCADLNTDAIGFMANMVAPIRITDAKNRRPYATAGIGMIRSWVTDPSNTVADTNQNNFAFNFGGGVMYSLNNRVGLRGDVRYFRALVNEDNRDGFYFNDYGFLRATFGVTFGFRGN